MGTSGKERMAAYRKRLIERDSVAYKKKNCEAVKKHRTEKKAKMTRKEKAAEREYERTRKALQRLKKKLGTKSDVSNDTNDTPAQRDIGSFTSTQSLGKYLTIAIYSTHFFKPASASRKSKSLIVKNTTAIFFLLVYWRLAHSP